MEDQSRIEWNSAIPKSQCLRASGKLLPFPCRQVNVGIHGHPLLSGSCEVRAIGIIQHLHTRGLDSAVFHGKATSEGIAIDVGFPSPSDGVVGVSVVFVSVAHMEADRQTIAATCLHLLACHGNRLKKVSE
jgi:hypothetical protein